MCSDGDDDDDDDDDLEAMSSPASNFKVGKEQGKGQNWWSGRGARVFLTPAAMG